MRIRLVSLDLDLKQGPVSIPFSDFNYFYGEMGAGKSSIVRLVDYCLGGSVEMTPALQSEFTAVTLKLEVNGCALSLTRQRDETTVRARWSRQGDFDVVIPTKKASGVVLPGMEIEVLSDLIFHLAGVQAPKVRKSKLDEDAELARLSLRDLLVFCYLDQESMDSAFFYLDTNAHPFRRLKSRDAFRFIVGFHHQRVAELEMELEGIRGERLRLEAGADSLLTALTAAQIGTEVEIEKRINVLRDEEKGVASEIVAARAPPAQPQHAVEELRRLGRHLAAELDSNNRAIADLSKLLGETGAHVNEMQMLSTKAKRAATAEGLLGNVPFVSCPRCAQKLPGRTADLCAVCAQPEPPPASGYDVVDADIKARLAELLDSIELRSRQKGNLERRVAEIRVDKARVDRELDEAMRQYDSAYLSKALMLERRRAALLEHIGRLQELKALPRQVEDQRTRADEVRVREDAIKHDLVTVRAAAERDSKNLRTLERLFVDCLVKAELPGFEEGDDVEIKSPDFVPVFHPGGAAGVVTTKFENLGSGGKKTLFKCCFAIAIHRLARQVGATLPALLVLDSPMKNISERENKAQFEGFHRMLYELAATELRDTQFVLVDKELFRPDDGYGFRFAERHMTPEKGLIPYYRGQ